jgi:ABC-2 type transport system permease protein
MLADLRDSRELLLNLTLREVRGKYKRTLLGHGWSLINPLATILIYSVVFGLLLQVEAEPGDPSGVDVFALFLTCGLLPWAFFSNSMSGGMSSLVTNANLVQKVYFPREVLVASVVFSWVVSFLIELGVLAVALLIVGASVIPWLPAVVVVAGLLTLFSLGVALMLSVANVYFRDTQHFMAIALQLWFFMTPIVYPLSYVEDVEARLADRGIDLPVVFLFRLNPMERFVAVFRSLMYDNRWPALSDIAFCVGATAAVVIIGYAVFKRFEGRLAEEL